MPLVLIKYDKKLRIHALAKQLNVAMARIVSSELHQDEAPIESSDVEIEYREHGPHDYNVLPVQITIDVRWTKRRSRDGDGEAILGRIINRIRALPFLADVLQPGKWYVWMRTPEAIFKKPQ